MNANEAVEGEQLVEPHDEATLESSTLVFMVGASPGDPLRGARLGPPIDSRGRL